MELLDNDMFSLHKLTQVVQKTKYQPARLGELGIFEPDYIDLTTFIVEITEEDGIMVLSPSARGGPGQTFGDTEGRGVAFQVAHFQINDSILADAVQGRRAIGTDAKRRNLVNEIAKKWRLHRQRFELTEESQRMGALKGMVVYFKKDGSVSHTIDLFDRFDVTPNPLITLNCKSSQPGAPILRQLDEIKRQTLDKLGNIGFRELRFECSNELWDAVIDSDEVRDSYKGTSKAEFLRTSYIGPNRSSTYGAFEYGGVIFENYRGTNQVNVGTGKAQMVPMGIPGLFKTVYGPADYNETVNTLGEKLYSKVKPKPNDKGYDLEMQSNPMTYCSRPEVLQEIGFEVDA